MADITDVLNAIGQTISSALYPTAPTSADALSVVGCPVTIVTEWPEAEELKSAMAKQRAVIGIVALPGETDAPRYMQSWEQQPIPAPTVTVALTGSTITLGGTVTAQNIVAVTIQGKSYNYALLGTDTLTTAAAGLLAAIQIDYAGATASGAVITLPATANAQQALAGAVGTASLEYDRRRRRIQISIWAPAPVDKTKPLTYFRTAIAKAIDAPLFLNPRIALPDGTQFNIFSRGSRLDDAGQKNGFYRRDLMCEADYGVTVTQQVAQVLGTTVTVAGSVVEPLA